jgi:hypothetical protein
MHCYECSKDGRKGEAVGLCHHCSAALCADHACVVTDPVTMTYPVFRTVALPKKARLFLCSTCLGAFEQLGARELTTETSNHCCAPALALRQ